MRGDKWTDVLPTPFNLDPEVVVVLAPNQASWKLLESKDGEVQLCVLELATTGNQYGLQVIKPRLDTWQEHSDYFEKYGRQMAHPVFVGRLSDVPQAVLMHKGLCPLAFVKEDMGTAFINLKVFMMKDEDKTVWS